MSASRKGLGSDLSKVDAYENSEADYAELAEVTDEEFARAKVHHAGKPARGRPPIGTGTKQLVSLRLDPEIQARFRSSGPGWQSRVNTFLLHNKALLQMIVEYDDSMSDMETLIELFRTGSPRPLTESIEIAIEKVEGNIRMTKQIVRGLREVLVWEPTVPVG